MRAEDVFLMGSPHPARKTHMRFLLSRPNVTRALQAGTGFQGFAFQSPMSSPMSSSMSSSILSLMSGTDSLKKRRHTMFAEQRRRQILQILDTHGSTTLTELTRLLGASESTVRRDLQEMDSKGLLVRVFGGAMSKNSKTDLREEDVSEKQTINIAEKQRIGKYAAALIKPDDFVYIDAGTTTGSMIPFITEYSAVYVTNAVAHGPRTGTGQARLSRQSCRRRDPRCYRSYCRKCSLRGAALLQFHQMLYGNQRCKFQERFYNSRYQ